ncbi:hypothetical protein CDR68_21710 [Salmonella enterica]|nr:hypothetical protein [Salmonella enterica]
MKYYRLSVDDSEDLWEKYKAFGIDFVVDGERLYCNRLCANANLKEMPIIKTLVSGTNPDFSMVGTDGIIVRKKVIDEHGLMATGISLISVMDEETEEIYYLIFFTESIECVNLELSAYEKWADNEELSSWSNPIGRFFFKPVLYANKIPEYLDAFTLKNWGGAFNFIVNENVKKQLQSIKSADEFLIFTELQVI